MDLPLRILVASPDEAFAARAARLLAGGAEGPILVERSRARDELRRASLRTDLDLVALDGRVPLDEHMMALRASLAARWRGPLVAVLGEDGTEEPLERLLACALERRRVGARVDQDAVRYRATFEHAASATLLLAASGRVLQANPASARLFGTSLEELLGRHFEDLFRDRGRDVARALFQRALGPTPKAPEAELELSTALPQVAHTLLATVYDRGADPLFLVAELTDVSARRRAEAEAQRKQRIFEAILRVQAQFLREGGRRGVHGEILARLLELTSSSIGLLAEREESGRLVVRAAEWPNGGAEALALEGAVLDERRLIWAEGWGLGQAVWGGGVLLDPRMLGLPSNSRAVESYAALPLSRGRRCLGMAVLADAPGGYSQSSLDELRPLLGTAFSVLENLWQERQRANMERELRDSQRAHATLLSHFPGVAYRCRNDGPRTLEFASDGCRELVGLAAAEWIGREQGLLALVAEGDRERVRAEVQAALSDRRRFELTWRLCRGDGTERMVLEQGCGVYDPQGELRFVEGFLSDISARLSAEEERRQLELRVWKAQKLESLGVLAGGIAHDFNNLLLAILGHVELARRGVAADSPAARSLAAIEGASVRAAQLTEHMLAYTGRGTLSPHPMDLSAAITGARPSLEHWLPAGVRLHLDLCADLPLVESDPARIREMLVQTLRNAAEAMAGCGGDVWVRTRLVRLEAHELAAHYTGADLSPGDYVALEVQDSGPGMEEEVRSRALDPFFTTKEPGRGLGLSAVLGDVRAHGGAMAIQSEPNRGTRVTLLFPPDSAGWRPAPEPRPAPPSAPRAPTVLVVDDEPLVRELAEALLTDAGYRVLAAQDGLEGSEVFAAHAATIDAVLLDLTMPRLDGEGALERIRAVRADAPVLLTSGFAEQEAMHRIASRAGVAFLQKPWRAEALLTKLAELCGRAP